MITPPSLAVFEVLTDVVGSALGVGASNDVGAPFASNSFFLLLILSLGSVGELPIPIRPIASARENSLILLLLDRL